MRMHVAGHVPTGVDLCLSSVVGEDYISQDAVSVHFRLLGIPLALVLGILTGLLNFIPNFGPILAAIPAVLVASAEGPQRLLYVVLLFVAIQNIEGFLLTPLVDKKTVALPPALEIFAEVLMSVLVGTIGIPVASPLAASLMVLVRMLYVEDMLGDHSNQAGDASKHEDQAVDARDMRT